MLWLTGYEYVIESNLPPSTFEWNLPPSTFKPNLPPISFESKRNEDVRIDLHNGAKLECRPPECVKCVNMMFLGVFNHEVYCVVVVMCVKSRHPLLCSRHYSWLKRTSVTQSKETYGKASNTAIGSFVVAILYNIENLLLWFRAPVIELTI